MNPCYTIDFETTNVDPKIAQPVEVAYYRDDEDGIEEYETLIYHDNIPVETSAVHHITTEDVRQALNWETVKNILSDRFRQTPLPVLVAHNAEYERTILGDFVPVLWVCTYKCALRAWPDAPAHKNEVLRYYLELGEDRGRNGNQRPHSAMHDAKVTMGIFKELLKRFTLAELLQFTEEHAHLPYMPMGKHYKQAWNTIPEHYLKWCISAPDMRTDVVECCKMELRRRRGG